MNFKSPGDNHVNIKFKRTPRGVTFNFADLTQGSALALCYALKQHATTSPVCGDLRIILQHKIQDAGKCDQDQHLFDVLKEGD